MKIQNTNFYYNKSIYIPLKKQHEVKNIEKYSCFNIVWYYPIFTSKVKRNCSSVNGALLEKSGDFEISKHISA